MNIEKLLQSADRPRELTPDELVRLRDRLGIDAETARRDEEPVVVELNPAPSGPTHPHRRGLGWLAVAAVMLVALGFVAVNGGGSDPDNLITGQTQSTLLEQVCSAQLVQLTEALEAWQGVENWVLTANGEPNVGELILDSLNALAEIDEFKANATEVLTALEAELGIRGEPAPGGSAAFDKRETAVRTALTELIEILRQADSGGVCALDRVEAAI